MGSRYSDDGEGEGEGKYGPSRDDTREWQRLKASVGDDLSLASAKFRTAAKDRGCFSDDVREGFADVAKRFAAIASKVKRASYLDKGVADEIADDIEQVYSDVNFDWFFGGGDGDDRSQQEPVANYFSDRALKTSGDAADLVTKAIDELREYGR